MNLFLTKQDRERLSNFPQDIPQQDVIAYFTLSRVDKRYLRKLRGDHNRLGFALQLCALRYMGFCPDDIVSAPPPLVEYLAAQLKVRDFDDHLKQYGIRQQTRTAHLGQVRKRLSYKKLTKSYQEAFAEWLLERALEHDKPTLLFQMVCERLKKDRIIRPGITVLERMVIAARQQAHTETYNRLEPLLTAEIKTFLDGLLVKDKSLNRSPLSWLRLGATANTSAEILETIEKLSFLRKGGIHLLDLNVLNPNRKKFLAHIGKRSTTYGLQQIAPARRYPILLCFAHQAWADIIDELVDLYDRCLAYSYGHAKHDLENYQLSIAKASNEKLKLFQMIGQLVLNDTEINDSDLRPTIYNHIPKDCLKIAVDECGRIIRPYEDHYDFWSNRYSHLREFAPRFLETLQFRSNSESDPLMDAIELLKRMNSESKRKIPDDAPVDFIPSAWRPYVINKEGQIARRYYEICALWELRSALRSGNIWVEDSRRYANPETYLIPKDRWNEMRQEACRIVGIPENTDQIFQRRIDDLGNLMTQVDGILGETSKIRIEDNAFVISPLSADETSESSKALKDLISRKLPRVEIADLLIEVDSWTSFTKHLEHAGGKQPRTKELLTYLYASIFAQACNFGLEKMAEISGLPYNQLAWCTNWYLREETLQKAINALVNYQCRQPLSKYWGGGILSSSDGQRFPVPVKARNAAALPRYFGYGRGVTFYSWTSDQFSQYGSKVIPSTVRDATYVLDAILDNETELDIVEHMTDTSGYTELIFALFDMLGMQFSPRIRDIGDQTLYRIKGIKITLKNIASLFKGTIDFDLIKRKWDDMLRVVASLKLGWVTASLFIGKLKSYPQQNDLIKAFNEYGRLIKTIFILRYVSSEEYRRKIGVQLNKGEALHDLRQFLIFANEGKIWKSQPDDQANQTSCLTLLANAVIVWNTRYIQAITEQLDLYEPSFNDEDLRHISPCRFNHINKYGKYTFNVEEGLNRRSLRPFNENV